jgi:hypothetical protein
MTAGALRLLLFAALGPLVSMVAGNLAIGVMAALATGEMVAFPIGPELFDPENLKQSYFLGLLPSLLTGIVSLSAARRTPGWKGWLWTGLAGAIISAALAWAVFGIAPVAGSLRPDIFTLVTAIAGGVAGYVCAGAYDGLAALAGRR